MATIHSNIGVPFSAPWISPRWSTCQDFLAQMNFVRSLKRVPKTDYVSVGRTLTN